MSALANPAELPLTMTSRELADLVEKRHDQPKDLASKAQRLS